MQNISQKAVDLVEKAVHNLRRGLSLSTFRPESEERIKEYVLRRTQQSEMLCIWEYVLSCVLYPRDAAIEDIHYDMIKAQGEAEQYKIMNEGLIERLNMAHDKVEEQKKEIAHLEKEREARHEKVDDGD